MNPSIHVFLFKSCLLKYLITYEFIFMPFSVIRQTSLDCLIEIELANKTIPSQLTLEDPSMV